MNGPTVNERAREAIPRCAEPFLASAVHAEMPLKCDIKTLEQALRALAAGGELIAEQTRLPGQKRLRTLYRRTAAFKEATVDLVAPAQAADRLNQVIRKWLTAPLTAAAEQRA